MKFEVLSAYLDDMYVYYCFCKENYSLVSNYKYDLVSCISSTLTFVFVPLTLVASTMMKR